MGHDVTHKLTGSCWGPDGGEGRGRGAGSSPVTGRRGGAVAELWNYIGGTGMGLSGRDDVGVDERETSRRTVGNVGRRRRRYLQRVEGLALGPRGSAEDPTV